MIVPSQAARLRPPATILPAWLLWSLAGVLLPLALAGGIATAHEREALGTLAGLLGLWLIVARPFWGLILFVVLFYLRLEESVPALVGMRLALAVAVLTLLGAWVQSRRTGQRMLGAPIHGTIPAFGLVAILSTVPNGDTLVAAQEMGKLVMLVYLVLNLVRTPERYRALTTTILLCTGYLAVYAIWLLFTGRALATNEGDRAIGTGVFGDPNDLATVIVVGLALTLARLSGARPSARLGHGLLAGVLIWGVFLTRSRGGLLALLFVLCGTALLCYPRRGVAVGLAALVAVAVLAAGSGRMRNFDSRDPSANVRLWCWSNGLVQVKSHPIWGVGYGRFQEVSNGRAAHNSFVLCFTEVGLLGYFFWMGALYYCFRRPDRPPGRAPDQRATADLRGARLALGGYLVGAFWLSHTYLPTLYLAMCLPIAQQIATTGPTALLPFQGGVRAPDAARIALVCIASILLIKGCIMFLL